MSKLKNILLLSILAIYFSGCNIYRQMTIPTPYYPNGNQPVKTTAPMIPEQTKTTQSTTSFTPVKDSTIKTVNNSVVQRIPFPEDEYISLPKTGKAGIKGTIFVTTPGGSKVYGKETRLYLNPVTSYSTQWYQKSYLGGAKMSKVDPRLFNYLKFTTSDSSGHFEFLNVPSGSYYLIGVVKCGGQCGYRTTRTIRVAKKVSVFGNDIKEVNLTKEIN